MPFYDYRCTQCGRQVEVWHGIDGQGPASCDVCGGAMKKALSTPAIHFKGSGWAKMDARAATTAKAGANDEPKSTGSKGDGDSETAKTKDAGSAGSDTGKTSGSTDASTSGSAGGTAASPRNTAGGNAE